MTRKYAVAVEGQVYTVMVSDDREALLAAKAAGTASVELWGSGRTGETRAGEEECTGPGRPGRDSGSLFLSGYAVESLEDITREYLEQVVRRQLGLPWEIAGTRRLVIREFQGGDEVWIPCEPEDREADRVFRDPVLLREYIRCQYGFYGYGIWAVTDRESGRLVGKAGVTNLEWEFGAGGEPEDALELGYHIFTPYRRHGYGEEACQGILKWCRGREVYAKTDASNQASVNLLKKLGFCLTDQRCSESGQWRCLYVRSC